MNSRCAGCGGPRTSLSPYCRYCGMLVADTFEVARVVADMRVVGHPAIPVPRKTTQAVRPAASELQSWMWLNSLRDWIVNIVCVMIVAVPLLFVLWCMLVAMFGVSR